MTTFPLTGYRPSTPVADLLRQVATQPDKPLLLWEDGQWSYAQFADYARRCAAHLRRGGIEPGQRVAIIARNSAWRQAWQYGAWWIGAVEVSVNYDLNGELLRNVLADAEPAVIVLDEEFRDTVSAAFPGHPTLLETTGVPGRSDEVCPQELDELAGTPRPGDLASLIYTSGTTGPSKGVMLPAGYPSGHGYSIRHVLDLRPDDVGYFVLPFFHADFHVVMAAVVQSGSAVAFRHKFTASGFWDEVRRYGATWCWVVGFVLSAVMAQGIEVARGHTMRRFLGAPIPEGAYEFFEDRLGVTILTMYGQTEADGPTFDTFERRRRGAAGWPSVGFEVQIHDDDGVALPPGEPGELVYRPRYPHMTMLGYWNRPDATVAAWRDLWVRSGDQARMDEDGFLYFMGRMTDSIRRRGENVSAYEVETILRRHPGIAECGIVGVHDEFSGEQEIKAFVVPEDEDRFDVDDFVRYCREHLPRYAVPRFLELTAMENIVRSAGTGVVQKHRLLSLREEQRRAVYTIDVSPEQDRLSDGSVPECAKAEGPPTRGAAT
ncbi:AMP-binding protein [Sediminivirga luteola]|uniref:ATP-dependent acyl-CoA ligase n=1 Tax=Sediminivirga luteola TaxID=1774748 RepID=A0A8J2XLM2_9MICO|nr:AMP-binding protein [Sediminivirga luteola]GGA23773.1 ATP-dependent acyl-CoA ligase [Sediminivirga luteola]